MKIKKSYTCQNCSYESPKWLGKCPECMAWNSFEEELSRPTVPSSVLGQESSRPVSLSENLEKILDESSHRLALSLSELNRVLGGGLFRGSLILLGGDPGVGKSTLLLESLRDLSSSCLYCSGEESAQQILQRAHRLGVRSKGIHVLSENNLEALLNRADELKPEIMIIDSIQTVSTIENQAIPGTISQIRDCTLKFLQYAKSRGIAIILVGHITKEGTLAGPKVLEHMVDGVFHFEYSSTQALRILRVQKNRFGSAHEMAVFEMNSQGLRQILNPSEFFLTQRTQPEPGISTVATLEGSRSFLVEVQALVTRSYYGSPRRTALGFDFQRLNLILAILEKHLGLQLYDQDIYVNIAGGYKLEDPAADLAVASSVLSSFWNKPIPLGTVILGELGLTGEVRPISFVEMRMMEASRLGYRHLVLPSLTRHQSGELGKQSGDLKVSQVQRLAGLSELIFV